MLNSGPLNPTIKTLYSAILPNTIYQAFIKTYVMGQPDFDDDNCEAVWTSIPLDVLDAIRAQVNRTICSGAFNTDITLSLETYLEAVQIEIRKRPLI